MRESGASQKKSFNKRGKKEVGFSALDSEETLTVTLANRSKEKAVITAYQRFLTGDGEETIRVIRSRGVR